MSHSRTTFEVYPRQSRCLDRAGMRTAVSLHSHSACSRESLAFLPDFARQISGVAALLKRGVAAYQRANGRPLDFSEWYWRPPVAPVAVIASERLHLERRLELGAIVSLTDHDSLEGPLLLRASGHYEVPLSLEWTVPYGRGIFHLGVHGLRDTQAQEIAAALAAYTTGSIPAPEKALTDILEWIGECPESLVVLNHPYWDLGRIGQLRHDSILLAFLRAHRDRVHAVELNGYRTWAENRRVLPLGEGFGIPVVGGGDRHGFRPNTIVNLTPAACFAEFVAEVRVERAAHCVFFPEYSEPFATRLLQTADDVLKPERGLRRRPRTWADRVFRWSGEHEQPVSSMWAQAPLWLEAAVGVTRLLGTHPVSAFFGMRRSDGHETLEADCGAPFEPAPRLASDSIAAA